MSEPQKTREPVHITTGAGIAIAGAWLAGAAITITILILMSLGDHSQSQTQKIDGTTAIFELLIIATPMIAAYSISRVILGKDD